MSERALRTIRSTYAIEQRVHTLLARHLPTYLDEVARQQSPDARAFTPPERPTLVARTAVDRVDAGDLPALVVAVEGTSGETLFQRSDGTYAAAYTVRLTAIARSEADPDGARELASFTVAAASAVLLHALADAGLGIEQVHWAQEVVADVEVPVDASTTDLRHVAERVLEADVRDVLNAYGEPPGGEPPTDPGDLPVVEETDVTVSPAEEIAA